MQHWIGPTVIKLHAQPMDVHFHNVRSGLDVDVEYVLQQSGPVDGLGVVDRKTIEKIKLFRAQLYGAA